MNAQDVLNRARTEGVELIRFMYCDFTGVQRGKVQTTSEHYLPLWGVKPTALDQCDLLDLHTLTLTR